MTEKEALVNVGVSSVSRLTERVLELEADKDRLERQLRSARMELEQVRTYVNTHYREPLNAFKAMLDKMGGGV